MPRTEGFTSSRLAFFDRHLAISVPDQLDLIALFGKDRTFLGLAGSSFWLVVASKSLPSVLESPRGESFDIFGRCHN